MIVIRNVFSIHPEKMKEAKAAVPQIQAINVRLGMPAGRALTDLTGPAYTLVLEMEWPSLAAFEQGLVKVMADPEWQAAYGRLRPLIASGHREVYSVVA